MVNEYLRRKQSTLDAPLRPTGPWYSINVGVARGGYYRWYRDDIQGYVLKSVLRDGDWNWQINDFRRDKDGFERGVVALGLNLSDAYTAMAEADEAAAKLGLEV